MLLLLLDKPYWIWSPSLCHTATQYEQQSACFGFYCHRRIMAFLSPFSSNTRNLTLVQDRAAHKQRMVFAASFS